MFDTVQKQSEASLAQNAVNAALTAAAVTPSFSGGSSSAVVGTSTRTKTKTAKKTPVVVSTNLDDYTDLELQDAMTNANGGDIAVWLQVDWARSLQSILGKEWNSESSMGATSATRLTVMHNLASAQVLHQKNGAFILMV